MSYPLDSAEVHFAVDAAREAALLASRVQSDLVTDALTKGDKSPVTVGDFASQAIVAHRLADTIPGAQLIGEESADDLRSPEGAETLERVTHFVMSILPRSTPEEVCDWIDRGAGEPGDEYWTLDPIDGTKGFLRGDQYAVALALVRDGRVVVGALGCPELQWDDQTNQLTPKRGGAGSLLVAADGDGCFATSLRDSDAAWTRVEVSTTADASKTRMLRSVEKGHTNLGAIDLLADSMGVVAPPVGMDSQAKYAALAAGEGEMLVRLLSADRPDYREKVWDQAAGSIVVQEAGGRVTDLDGKPLDFSHGRTLASNRGIVATNGHLHEAALAALREIDA